MPGGGGGEQVVERIGAQLAESLPEVVGTPCLGISALTGAGAERVMPTVMQASDTSLCITPVKPCVPSR